MILTNIDFAIVISLRSTHCLSEWDDTPTGWPAQVEGLWYLGSAVTRRFLTHAISHICESVGVETCRESGDGIVFRLRRELVGLKTEEFSPAKCAA